MCVCVGGGGGDVSTTFSESDVHPRDEWAMAEEGDGRERWQ